jgi:hypothetical protein
MRRVRLPGQLVEHGGAINQVWGRVCWEAMLGGLRDSGPLTRKSGRRKVEMRGLEREQDS